MVRKNNKDTAASPEKSQVGDQVGHPVATGAGAGAGALAGAEIGSPAGIVGIAAGAVIGGIVGALAGEGVADTFTGNEEDRYWREEYARRPYARPGDSYERYQPAYRYGSAARSRFDGQTYDEVEPSLREDWNRRRAESDLRWEDAGPAVRDAYEWRSGLARPVASRRETENA